MAKRAPILTLALALVGVAIFLGILVGDARAQSNETNETQNTETRAPLVAVLRGPGEIGYWLVTADGKVEVVGTSIVPSFSQSEIDGAIDGAIVGARIGAPGALGIWLRQADGTEIAVGDPGPNIETAHERPTGWLVGVSTSQLMKGSWWPDIDLACTAELPRSVRIGQTLMPSLTERNFGAAVSHTRNHRIGGILLDGGATEHIWRRIGELQELAERVPLLFAVDEEGGSVQRLRGVLPRLPSAESQAKQTPGQVAEIARQHALAMAELGFNVNLAPVLDVGSGPGIGSRSFGNDPTTVTEYGVATVTGISNGGVLAVVKHFPGHGGASADSHLSQSVTESLDELRTRDLVPFTAAIGTEQAAVMIGHLVVPGLTDGMPASLSPAAVTGLLREELGHGGLVVSDSLIMRAITDRWSVDEASVLALIAGIDILLVGDLAQANASFAAISAAVDNGRLSQERLNEAANNVLRSKGVYACDLVGRVG